MPVVFLALTYAVHLLATVTWLGGVIVLVMASWPNLIASQDASHFAAISSFLDMLERRFRPWTNLSLITLLVTGMIQMGGDEHYQGLLQIESPWTLGLLAKHIVIGGILIVTAVLQWGIYPALERTRLLALSGRVEAVADQSKLRRRSRRLTTLNLGLGVLVLVLTAIITAL